jgi:serine/threonine protein kinase
MGNTPTKPIISYLNSITIQDSRIYELIITTNLTTKDYIIEHFYRISQKFGVVCLESRISESLDYILTQDLINFSYFQQTDTFYPVYWQPVNEELQLSDFKPIKIIGKGGFSTVILARKLDTGYLYAIKCLKLNQDNIEDRESVLMEMIIMKELNHPFIVEFKGVIESEGMIFIVMEFCPGGELLRYIESGVVNEDWAKFVFCEILAALEYLHSKNILYRDIKPENIMIDHDGHVKLIDFGLSKQLTSKHGYTYSFCGSSRYLSPEMQNGEAHSLTLDYFSLGMLLYEMLTGHTPSKESKNFSFPNEISKSCKSLLKGLLNKCPEERLGYTNIEEIKNHKWLKGIDWKKLVNKKFSSPIEPISRKSNFKEFPHEDILGIFRLKRDQSLHVPEIINAKDSFTSTIESKKRKDSEVNFIEDSGIFSSSIDNSLMINQVPTFISKFLY